MTLALLPARLPDVTESDPARARVLDLVKRFGFNSTSFQTLESGCRYWFDGDDTCVAYFDTGRAWVSAGAPLTSKERLHGAARKFAEHAARAGRRCAFFAIEQRFTQHSALPTLKVGAQPVWNPQRWQPTSRANRNLRAQLNRARTKGVMVRAVAVAELAGSASSLRGELATLATQWLATRRLPPMGFLVRLELFGFADERRYFVAERAGRCLGLLVAVPIYGRAGWLFEDLVRAPDAPNGTSELLVDFAMRAVAAEGSRFVTLGMVPLEGVAGVLRHVRSSCRALYDFRGLSVFREKFGPHSWEPVFLAHTPGTWPFLALHDALHAFAHGNFTRFALAALQRRRAGDQTCTVAKSKLALP